MITCPNCGTQNKDGIKFCTNCGANLRTAGATSAQNASAAAAPAQPQAVQERHCPNCGAVLTPNVKFCESCGTRLSEGFWDAGSPAASNVAAQGTTGAGAPSYQSVTAYPSSAADQSGVAATNGQKVKTVNKNLFIWVCSFLFGGLGVDRFVRGQIPQGIGKIVLLIIARSAAYLGRIGYIAALVYVVWIFADWIIAMTKGYGSAFKQDSEFVFIDGQYSK